MSLVFRTYLIFFSLLLTTGAAVAQKKYKIAGTIQDEKTKAKLSFANISIDGTSKGTTTDESGHFGIYLTKGYHVLSVTYVGFEKVEYQLRILGDTNITIGLKAKNKVLKEVEVVDVRKKEDQVVNVQSSAISMTKKEIEMVPTIAGENDIIKVVQLMPGVSKGIEGTGDFFVRGGDADQNLLLLDGATIYNTGHLFGFISIFNSSIIGEASILKGAFPSYYGGRLSSILDVRTQSALGDSTAVEGSIGLISSRLMIKTPLKKDKVGIMVSGRRTYIDQVIDVVSDELSLPYYFYDLNGRVDYKLNDKHQLYLSGYVGADILQFERVPENSENQEPFRSNNDILNHSQTLGWQYDFPKNGKMNTEVHHSVFKYNIVSSLVNERISARSGIEDLGVKWNLQLPLGQRNLLNTGISVINHRILPIEFLSDGLVSEFIPSSRSTSKNATEMAVFGELTRDISSKLRLRLGYRQALNMAQGTLYPGFEPRIALRYAINDHSSLKWSYSRMTQVLHRVSSSSITLPVDLWYIITDDIKPQSSDQLTIGYAWNSVATGFSIESDIYYKFMRNLTEYEPGTSLLFNADFESSLLQGNGNSYGWEIMLRKRGEKLYGWVSYSLGWSTRQFEELNDGRAFFATYDRRHNAAIVLQYNLSKRLAVSSVWEFLSGSRFTPVIGQYAVVNPDNSGVEIMNVYSDRNAVKLSNSHRLDLMLIFKSKPEKRIQSEWRAGLYNVYNRATPIQTYVSLGADGSYEYIQPGLFGTLPFISYNFKF